MVEQRVAIASGRAERTAGNAYDVRIRSIADFLADGSFQVALEKLVQTASEPDPFAEPWYLRAALSSMSHPSEPTLAEVWDGNLIGLVPLHVESGYGGTPVRYVRNWSNHNAFLGTPLVRAGCEEQFWRSLLGWLDVHDNGGLFLHFGALAIDGPVAQGLVHLCARQRRRIALVQSQERALLERGLSPADYLEKNLKGKKRKELRRQQSRLAELGALVFERSDGTASLDQWIAEFLALERRGWKGENGSALDCADETRELFRKALQGAAEAKRLELLAMRLDGRAIAMLANFITPPGAFSFKTAFDEDYARFSPGVLLQIENLKLLERDDVQWCDSCAAQDHPMIDSIWAGRRRIGRYSVAIGGPLRRAAFSALLTAEQAKARLRGFGTTRGSTE